MRSWMGGGQGALRALCGAALVLACAQSALAEIYAWRTEDGGYAYADDKDQIPARYRDQAKRLGNRSLQSYERFTPQDPAASARYQERLERRLQALREVNARSVARAPEAQPAAPGKLMISTGGEGAPQIEVPMNGAAASAPVVVEPGLSKRGTDMRTRRTTVVRQGDRTIAILKGPPHNFDPVNGILDEDELERGAD